MQRDRGNTRQAPGASSKADDLSGKPQGVPRFARRLDWPTHTSPHNASGVASVQRIRIGAEMPHDAGPRAFAEFLIEFADQHALQPEMVEALSAWGRLDPAMVRSVLDTFCGGRQFPMRLVEVPHDGAR